MADLKQVVETAQAQKLLRTDDTHTILIAAWSIAHGLSMLVVEGRFGIDELKPAQLSALSSQLAQIVSRGSAP
jgi:hypothetical protein